MTVKRIVFLIYNGFELLDLSGPSGVFNNANVAVNKVCYELILVSEAGGAIRSSEGFKVDSIPIDAVTICNRDTIIVVGARSKALSRVRKNSNTLLWLVASNPKCERLASVCSGAFILAEAGLLDGKSATTHWLSTQILKLDFPAIKVDEKAIYINDGKIWSSAGVTTGVDMALEMVRRDLGSEAMSRVAKGLVVYAHRLGNQSQFSQLLDVQTKAGQDFVELLLWVENNISKSIRVNDMSEFMHMSERTFYRRFTKATGTTPSKYVEKTRLSRAKNLLEDKVSIKQVMQRTGFHSEAGFRQSFVSAFGVTPGDYKKMHGKH